MRLRIRAAFATDFPAWANIETPWFWNGLACITRSLAAYVGPVPGLDGAYAAFGYHGGGVAMASWSGARVADLLAGTLQPSSLPPLIARAAPALPAAADASAVPAAGLCLVRLARPRARVPVPAPNPGSAAAAEIDVERAGAAVALVRRRDLQDRAPTSGGAASQCGRLWRRMPWRRGADRRLVRRGPCR